MVLRWKKQPRETGLRAVCQGQRGYILSENGKVYAHIQARDRWKNDLWFWYGMGVNTSHRPDTLENCKAEAIKFIKDKLSINPTADREGKM